MMDLKTGKDSKPVDEVQSAISVLVMEMRLTSAEKFYKRKGSVVPFINTCVDLTNAQKEQLFDLVTTRIKGSPITPNPFTEKK